MTDSPLANTPSSVSPQRGEAIERLEQEANRTAQEFERQDSGSLSDSAREARESAAREGSKLANRFKEKASSFAEDQKRSGTEKLERIAGAVGRAADDLEKESPETARYVRSAAESVRDFSSSLRDRRVEDLAADARDFARRQPWLVFGGAVLAGLAVTRFLKSSREREDREHQDRQSTAYRSDEFGGMR
jgi:hypothetical protein